METQRICYNSPGRTQLLCSGHLAAPLTLSVGELACERATGELCNQEREGMRLQIWFWNFPALCENRDDCMTKSKANLPMALERH